MLRENTRVGRALARHGALRGALRRFFLHGTCSALIKQEASIANEIFCNDAVEVVDAAR